MRYKDTKFKYNKGTPINCILNEEKIMALFFKSISNEEAEILIINNEFTESDKIIINKKDIL